MVSAIAAIPAPIGYVDVVSSESRPFGQKRMQERERERKDRRRGGGPSWKVRRFTDEPMHVSVHTFTQ